MQQAVARRRRPRRSPRALVVAKPSKLEFERFDDTAMFDTLGKVRALTVDETPDAVACRSIAETRGYSDDELYALAEVGYHYIRNGGLRLALVIFEGLTAIKPEEPYFWLALGLVTDYLGDKSRAHRCYKHAGKLDPADPRPDLNVAELHIERGDKKTAIAYLRRASQKARRAGDEALENKANALLGLV